MVNGCCMLFFPIYISTFMAAHSVTVNNDVIEPRIIDGWHIRVTLIYNGLTNLCNFVVRIRLPPLLIKVVN